MKIAFTAKGTTWDSAMDPRFGRADYILLYDDVTKEMIHYDNLEIEGVAHGAGSKTARVLYDMNPEVLITGNGPGNNAAAVLNQISLKIYVGAGNMSVKAAFDAYLNGELKEF